MKQEKHQTAGYSHWHD